MKRIFIILFSLLFGLNSQAQFLINPYAFAVADTAPLLDTYPADVAFSLRKLRTAYSGNCIEVRRSSDNTSQVIGFVNNYVDTAAIKTFVGAGNGFIRTWYDQSGNANNGTQTTAGSQPQIVSGGALLMQGSKVRISSVSKELILTTTFTVNTDNAVIQVGKRETNSAVYIGLGTNGVNGAGRLIHFSDDKIYLNRATGFAGTNSTYNDNPYCLMAGYNETGDEYIVRNGSELANTFIAETLTATLNRIGRLSNTTLSSGSYQEIIFWNSAQYANRSAIETNINTFYSIY
jgi:hypothetical protein